MWSFGVLLWEIMSLGGHPYAFVDNRHTEIIFELLKSGTRMEAPRGCPHRVYGLMRRCWRSKPEDRPTFHRLVDDLDHIMTQDCEYYLDMRFPVDDSTLERLTFGSQSSGSPVTTGSTLACDARFMRMYVNENYKTSTPNCHAHPLPAPPPYNEAFMNYASLLRRDNSDLYVNQSSIEDDSGAVQLNESADDDSMTMKVNEEASSTASSSGVVDLDHYCTLSEKKPLQTAL